MLKVYGSLLCPNCVACKQAFEEAQIEFEYYDFAEELASLKTFLAIRDSDPQFEEVKRAGRIGIPCIVREDGTVGLDWKEFTSM